MPQLRSMIIGRGKARKIAGPPASGLGPNWLRKLLLRCVGYVIHQILLVVEIVSGNHGREMALSNLSCFQAFALQELRIDIQSQKKPRLVKIVEPLHLYSPTGTQI